MQMNTKESMDLGELFRELRIARGLKLKDVASDKLSVSQLSKFENGQTMLSSDKLLVAISGIHMNFSEFGYALNNYQEPEFFKLGEKIAALHSKQDIDGLKKLLVTYKGYESFDVYNRLNLLVIKVAIHSLDNGSLITDEDKKFLTNYLYEIEAWTEYELYIFGNTMSILSDSDLIFLGKAFEERSKLYSSLTSHKKSAEIAFLNLILILIERKEIYYVRYFMSKLEEILNYQDMFAITCLHVLKQVSDYLNGDVKSIEKIDNDINMIEKLGNPIVASFLRINLQQFLH
ncbi:Rgg/GadR/MutR family transcriptional regulator [Streptococcus gordonii]|jgi:transcriptional activator, rgg/gadR/mutR family, C-terminal domain|nr:MULTISPECIES: Rgg/GadR/MutR family transcriptional regulator [Streptococcus]MCY7132913.1 Rgg/GadR/MutR family transcriptional regulator [Streptococcus gordonii]MCY7136218.1 Rgg/GadR/MutR family transcriptional regulator [Streptococcus gordonii]MCY7143043.1 Rgg/GadR/MutR family transcriptional regulator [Streptococcus gordonii]MCY7167420.1 Rgg/GadR/MutR family transcriptional regulator [Streptococcus gordonii]WAM21455.1 Rgg/GadR/MutR family transcriptional regulator [Streptococcus gordonii]